MVPPPELIDVLGSARSAVVAGHVSPDTDALGAMLALARVLPAGRGAVALARRPAGAKLRFLLEYAEVPLADTRRLGDADLLTVLDTTGPKRVGLPCDWADLAGKTIVNIDHHLTNEDFGRINWVVAGTSSTSELVYRLIVAAGWPLAGRTAGLLYAGIHADTCGFSLPTARAETFEAAAHLLRAGADLDTLGARLLRTQSPHEFELLRTVYRNTRLAAAGRIAYGTLTRQEIAAAGCTPDDIDNQVAVPRSLADIRIAMLFSEAEPGVVRVNLRGENGTPVLPLAVALGGGGHMYSAGVRVRGPFEEVLQRVLTKADEYLAHAAPPATA